MLIQIWRSESLHKNCIWRWSPFCYGFGTVIRKSAKNVANEPLDVKKIVDAAEDGPADIWLSKRHIGGVGSVMSEKCGDGTWIEPQRLVVVS